jgi:hypothetical protein
MIMPVRYGPVSASRVLYASADLLLASGRVLMIDVFIDIDRDIRCALASDVPVSKQY